MKVGEREEGRRGNSTGGGQKVPRIRGQDEQRHLSPFVCHPISRLPIKGK